MRDSFVFYRSFYEAMEDMAPADALAFFDACCEFALNDNDVSDALTGVAKSTFTIAKMQLEASCKRYDLNRYCAEQGKKGGRPRKSESAENLSENLPENLAKTHDGKGVIENENPFSKGGFTPSEKGDSENETLNVNVNVNENVNSHVNENENVNISLPPKGKREMREKEIPPHFECVDEKAGETSEPAIDGSAFRAFIDEFGIVEDNINPGDLYGMDFNALSDAYRLSGDYLQKNPTCRRLGWVVKNYKAIVGGCYDKWVDERDGKKDKRSTFDRLRALRDEEA